MSITDTPTLRQRLDDLRYTHQVRVVNPAERPSNSTRESDGGWSCSASGSVLPCQGDLILDVEVREWDPVGSSWGPWRTTYKGMCRVPEHRRRIAEVLFVDENAYDFVARAHTVELIWSPILDDARAHDLGRLPAEPGTAFGDLLETEQGLTLTPAMNNVQSKVFQHLTSGEGDRYARRTTLRNLVHLGFFDIGLNSECRDFLTEYLDTVYGHCGGGRERFEAVLSGGVEPAPRRPRYESDVTPEPTPAPVIEEVQAWFPDQRITYSAEAIRNHNNLDAGQRFVTVEALVDAIREYKGQYDLCTPGVTEFLSEFGLSLERTVTIALKDTDGEKHDVFRMRINASDLNSLSDGDMDGSLNEKIVRVVADQLGISTGDIELDHGFDCYSREGD